MMTKETLKTIERLSQNGWQSDAETVLALVGEVERQREEIAALRGALEPFAAAGRVLNSKPSRGGALSDIVWSINDAAITVSDLQRADYLSSPDNAPAPEPAPEIKVGDSVRVKVAPGMDGGLTGKVTVVGIHTVSIVTNEGRYFGYPIYAVELVKD